MLPYFGASGHNSYTKSVYVYLQDMQKLKQTNIQVYNFFMDGNFVTRRSDRFWAGLPDDLVIEQVKICVHNISKRRINNLSHCKKRTKIIAILFT